LAAVVLLALAPWLFHAGSLLANAGGDLRRAGRQPLEYLSSLAPSRRAAFYVLAALVTAPLLVIGLSALLRGDPIWLARAKIATTWGALIVVFYLPLHFLAFYVRQADARTPRGRAFSALLALAAIGATLVIGQRTNALLPLLILALFT